MPLRPDRALHRRGRHAWPFPPNSSATSALVPALNPLNWLMMHGSAMLCYATLLVGSLSCMLPRGGRLEGWTGAKGALGFVEGMATKDASAGATAGGGGAASSG